MENANEFPGLTNPVARLERVPIRTRGGRITLSAWRLVVSCGEGAGSITLVEPSHEAPFYRGDGVFLGWSRDALERAWEALGRTPDEPETAMPQLG